MQSEVVEESESKKSETAKNLLDIVEQLDQRIASAEAQAENESKMRTPTKNSQSCSAVVPYNASTLPETILKKILVKELKPVAESGNEKYY